MKTQKQIMGKTIVKLTLMAAMLVLSTAMATAQITVGGNVFGGGRKADVNGNTSVNVSGQQGSEKKTILNGVFGGNDIAGQVATGDGKVGSTIVIGKTGKTNEIHISEVYGGGNGYYKYGSTSVSGDALTTMSEETSVYARDEQGNQVGGDVIETLSSGKYVPTIPTTRITVNGSKTFINEMFGGAKNAYITQQYCSLAAAITVKNGVMGKVFGGNNYGGYIHGNIDIDIDGTVEPDSKDASENYYAKVGKVESVSEGVKTYYTDGFGIAQLYGGGNKVPAPGNVDISVTGGMIDQCFAGGNSATVGGHNSCGSPAAKTGTTVTVNTNSDAIYAKGGDNYDGESGVYNIRTLFGGNNQAEMDILPTLTLTKGGIGTVYGGGNAGNMTGDFQLVAEGPHVSTNIQFAASDEDDNMLVDVVYGGCKSADVAQGTNINLNSTKTTIGTIYGACNVSGAVRGDSYVTLAAGKVEHAVFGGANGDYGCNNGTIYTDGPYAANNSAEPPVPAKTIPTIKNTHVYVQGATIGDNDNLASIYGGGNMAPVGSSSEPGTTEVKLVSGTVTGSAFGGGNMASVYGRANIYTPEESTITITNIYGGNDKSGSVTGAGYNGELALDETTELTADNAASYVKLEGSPTITNVYGGGNGAYTYPYEEASCEITSAPVQNSSFVDIKTTGGTITTTYGGGNAAGVSKDATTILALGTVGTIFGGCNAADVGVQASTLLNGGNVTTVYGGNDRSGNVVQSVVDLKGSTVSENIYGAGKGDYQGYYTETIKRPTVGQTVVTLNGGAANGNIYGGGLAGDVTSSTEVVVEATTQLADNTIIFGGGCGDISAIGACGDRVGNVKTANLIINGLSRDLKAVYGGGHNGNVEDAVLIVNNTVTEKIETLYGGCYASNLTGTTEVTLGTKDDVASNYPKIDVVYGGNNYSGLTQTTELTINSGTYTHVYGAGNGDYKYWQQTNKCDSVPYSMYVDLTFNGGTFTDHVYGGGNMGLVGDKSMTSSNHPEGGTGTDNFDMYGYIHMKIHGGDFQNRVFAGASGTAIGEKRFFGINKYQPAVGTVGADGYKPPVPAGSSVLAYAYKQVDMDGGNIHFSLHGGSEGVDDGFPYECQDSPKNRTTERPSTVINIVGGTVEKSLYGGGYEGSTYGSIYVNVGIYAALNSPVWTNTYGRFNGTGDDATRINSWSFADDRTMGEFRAKVGQLTPSALYLRASVYNGNDWGEAGRSQYFDTRGFYGGRGLVYVDGMGYLTSRTYSNKPQMEISNSLFGSGTSTAPADISSSIWVKNYGDYSCPHPHRNFFSIQRTDTLLLYNSYFRLSGESDAFYAHTSSVRSMNRIGTVIFHERNLVETDAPSEYIGTLISEDADGNGDGVNHLYTAANLAGIAAAKTCDDETSVSPCDLIYGDVLARNTLIMNDGSYMSIRPFKDVRTNGTTNNVPDHLDDGDAPYGPILGYIYVTAEPTTLASITARPKHPELTDKMNPNDGGLVSPCSSSNTYNENSERPYVNMDHHDGYNQLSDHRSWAVGVNGGDRTRKITLVAHADPDRVDENKHIGEQNVTTKIYEHTAADQTYQNFAYTTASLVLPPADGGHFYSISSVTIDGENGGQVDLQDWAYDEAKNSSDQTIGWWVPWDAENTPEKEKAAIDAIKADPSYSFGLMFKLGDYFGDAAVTGQPTPQNKTVVSGNQTLVGSNGFTSYPIISEAVGVLPTIDFTLVYNTKMETTIARDVTFTLDEYYMDGEVKKSVGPVEVTVTISTIISDFEDMHPTVLAMYNEGLSSKYTRKVVIPASFEERQLYIDGIEWKYSSETSGGGTVSYAEDVHFQDTNRSRDAYNLFALSFTPSQRVTDNISNSLGWYDIHTTNIDLSSLSDRDGTFSEEKGGTETVSPSIENNNLSRKWFDEPILLGTLDGRATAAFDVNLFYNGNLMYKKIMDLAHVVLHCRYVNKKEVEGEKPEGTFDIDIRLWTRDKGDTIYMAEPAMLTLHQDGHVEEHDMASTNPQGVYSNVVTAMYRFDNPNFDSYQKNDPIVYMDNFKKALHNKVYLEGDVISIMGPIHISDPQNPFGIQGSNYSNINIVRYAGNHPRLPGDAHTYRGPLMVVENGSKLTISNARINGSGCSRIAEEESASSSDISEGYDGLIPDMAQIKPLNPDDGDGFGTFVLKAAAGGAIYLQPSTGTYVKYDWSKRNSVKDTNYVHAPLIEVRDNSQLYVKTNVELLNNFNMYDDVSATDAQKASELFEKGGAIYMEKTYYKASDLETVNGKSYVRSTLDRTGEPGNYQYSVKADGTSLQKNAGDLRGVPIVSLGDMIYFNNNLVVNGSHAQSSSIADCGDLGSRTYNWVEPGNKGGAIYVNGGQLTLGATTDDDVQITENYFSPKQSEITSSNMSSYFEIVTHSYKDVTLPKVNDEYQTVSYDVYKPLTTTYAPSNVFLTRTKGSEGFEIVEDGDYTSVISVRNQLAKKSRIAVSKWFPGNKWRDNCIGRDTVSIASYLDALAAKANYEDGVWIDDSASVVNGVSYHIYKDGSNAAVQDQVTLLYSTLLNYYNVYLHRCATFTVSANPLAWEMDESVVCPGDGDKVTFTVEGGVPAYTYEWYLKPGADATFNSDDTPAYVDITESKSGSYVPLNLNLPIDQTQETYRLYVHATDGGGLCEADHYMDILLVQTGSDDEGVDASVGVHYVPANSPDKAYAQSKRLDDFSKFESGTHYEVPGYKLNNTPNGLTSETPKKLVRTYTYRKASWEVSPAESGSIAVNDDLESGTSKLCPGDVVTLTVTPYTGKEFMMWDYDPAAGQTLNYVVGNKDNEKLTAYMAPADYWWRTVTSSSENASPSDNVAGSNSYEVDYHGNVHIYDEKGLAWLISTTNGLNYQQHRTFIYDTIYIHDADNSGKNNYDMSAHKWTPLGNIRDAFRGTIKADKNVTISGIIVKETLTEYVGFFGQTDSARINNLTITNSTIKGNQYGGGLVGYAGPNTEIHTVTLGDVTVSAANMVGGLAGKSLDSYFWNNTVGTESQPIHLVGSSLYAGGISGDAQNVYEGASHYGEEVPEDSKNNKVYADASKLSGLYVGGVFGISTKPTTISASSRKHRRGAKSVDEPIHIHNNYVNFVSGNRSLYVGGLVGSASQTDLQNNYVYGEVQGIGGSGALIARVGEDVNVENCYFQNHTSGRAFGSAAPGSSSNITTFSGQGNQVKTAQAVGGIDNMTRILNNWVFDHAGDNYETWRSDLDGVNSGYPIFGKPDIVPVYDTVYEVVCDSMNLDGILITESGSYKTIYSKPEEFVDSILTIVLTVNHSDRVEYTDTIHYGEDYYGNGFSLTAEQISELSVGFAVGSVRVLQIVDSLLTEQGCDSLVVLNLLVCKNGDLGVDEQVRFDVKVYPNPTAGVVNVEADGLQSVEVYDALSRKMKEVKAVGDKVMFDLTSQADGSYYLRIRTDHGVAIHKVIKN